MAPVKYMSGYLSSDYMYSNYD